MHNAECVMKGTATGRSLFISLPPGEGLFCLFVHIYQKIAELGKNAKCSLTYPPFL